VNYFSEKSLEKDLKKYLYQNYKDTAILENVSNHQIFLNYDKIKTLQIDVQKLYFDLKSFCYQYPEIAEVYTKSELITSLHNHPSIYEFVSNGFNPSRSGDIVFVMNPGNLNYGLQGTTHGSGYNYDTHVPLLFYGFKNKALESTRYYRITQIAPTLAFLLNINIPNACFDVPIDEVIDNVNVNYPPLNNLYEGR
jgi:hypothetical protein